MKKQLQNDPNGFYLPYAVFISMIVFIGITSAVTIYQNNIQNTYKLMEQIEVETMMQMSKATFINEGLYKTSEEGEVNYDFPYGHVTVVYKKRSQNSDMWELGMNITTKSGRLIKKMLNILI